MEKDDFKRIFEKIQTYCAYQERCTQEVCDKLRDYETPPELIPKILEALQEYKFLDEQRYTNAFVRGKFRFKKWGRIKIQMELRMRKVASEYIEQAFEEEIDHELYLDALRELIELKQRSVKESHPYKRKQKLAQYALSRGFESEFVWQVLKESAKTKEEEDDGRF